VAYPDGWDGEADFACEGAVGAMTGGRRRRRGLDLGARAWGRRLLVVVFCPVGTWIWARRSTRH
jgi:hypothetical protein